MYNSLYKKYKNQVDIEQCSSCLGYGRLYDEGSDDEGFECKECLGTGIGFSYDYQEDKKFFLSLLKVLQSKDSWETDRGRLMSIIDLNPAAQIIEMEHRDDSYMIIFRSHACYIEDGKLKKFF